MTIFRIAVPIPIVIVTVKDMMGHSNIATTQRYDKRGADKMKAAVKKLNVG